MTSGSSKILIPCFVMVIIGIFVLLVVMFFSKQLFPKDNFILEIEEIENLLSAPTSFISD